MRRSSIMRCLRRFLLFWEGGHLWEVVTYIQEVVALGGLTLYPILSREVMGLKPIEVLNFFRLLVQLHKLCSGLRGSFFI